MEREQEDDAELVAAIPASADAFDTFYRRHVGTVLGFLARRCATPEDVADATAATFVAVLTWQKPTAASLAEIAEPSLPAGFKQLQEPFLVSPGTHFVLPVSRGGAHTTVPAATTTVPAATTTAPGSATTAPAATTTVPRCSPGTTHRQ